MRIKDGRSIPSVSAYAAAKPFFDTLRVYSRTLTQQQLRTLKGQALAGDLQGAMKGLRKILYWEERER